MSAAAKASTPPVSGRKLNKGRAKSGSSYNANEMADTISLSFVELKMIATAVRPRAGSAIDFASAKLPANVNTSPLTFDVATNAQLDHNFDVYKNCEWMEKLMTDRKALYKQPTQTLTGSLGAQDAVSAFCEIMAATQLGNKQLSFNISRKYAIYGGWDAPYGSTHSSSSISTELLQELQQKSVLQLLPTNLKAFLVNFPACKTLIDNFTDLKLDVANGRLKQGQSVQLSGASILFGYNPSVNFSFHSDADDNPETSKADITCVTMLGPGSSTLYIAGAEKEAEFVKPGDYHAFASALLHRSGRTNTLSVKLVTFFKVKWSLGPETDEDEEDGDEENIDQEEKVQQEEKVKQEKKGEDTEDEDLPAAATQEAELKDEAADGNGGVIDDNAEALAVADPDEIKKTEAGEGDANAAMETRSDGPAAAALTGTGEVEEAASENPELKPDESVPTAQSVSFDSDAKQDDKERKRRRTSR